MPDKQSEKPRSGDPSGGDMTHCGGDDCPRKERCLRFTAPAGYHTSWMATPVCEYFIDNGKPEGESDVNDKNEQSIHGVPGMLQLCPGSMDPDMVKDIPLEVADGLSGKGRFYTLVMLLDDGTIRPLQGYNLVGRRIGRLAFANEDSVAAWLGMLMPVVTAQTLSRMRLVYVSPESVLSLL